LTVSFAQVPFNDGFDLTKHAFSYLSIGATGGLQRANFILLGVLTIVAAAGLRRLLDGKTSTAAFILLALVGAGQVIAGLFTLDPSNGFPIGAPDGRPEHVSAHGNLHGVGFAISMLSWVVLLVVLGRWLARRNNHRWARANVGFAAALIVTAGCLGTSFGTVLLYIVLSCTWLYTSMLLCALTGAATSEVNRPRFSPMPQSPHSAEVHR
jgi:hypothetical protein